MSDMKKAAMKGGVNSPSNNKEGLIKNLGGMPATKTVTEIFADQTAPSGQAKDSTDGIAT